jgi:tetratricopeptide (TPR) repeat protein
MYDISGKQNMMKHILHQGRGVEKPSDNDELTFNYTIYNNDLKIIKSDCNKVILSLNNFNEAEMIMLKSMKKEEKARIDISKQYFEDIITQDSMIIKDIRMQLLKYNRIIYELELLKFKKLYNEYTVNDKIYEKQRLMKGIGYQCPWNKALVLLALEIKKDGEIIHTDFTNNLIVKLKDIKTRLKTIPNFEKNLQFLLDPEIANLPQKFHIYDLHTFLLPDFLTESIITMRLLEVQRFKCYSSIDYLKVDNTVIRDTKPYQYEITIALLNYQECFNFFNKSLQTMSDIYGKIQSYRELASNYFKQGHFDKARSINKYLVDEYIKYINLKDKGILNYNKVDTSQNVNIDISDLGEDMKVELKKAHSNLIVILYKLKEFKICDGYIELYFVVQNKNDEKIVYTKYRILYEQRKFEESKSYLEKLYEKNPEVYENEYKELNEKIRLNIDNNNKFVRKMFQG